MTSGSHSSLRTMVVMENCVAPLRLNVGQSIILLSEGAEDTKYIVVEVLVGAVGAVVKSEGGQ